ncbi:hypothetical protein B0A55_03465 [Friedmanniomyces simplex]|uniref:Uncharacterized protein n=1 Tax=Friedmanniomyces simplex TaxID=329884 RepID=A0A4U0XPI3_9PEZI|nr:hypothetical protein B0A55_03465 [Friedmanniomyces simplex]
MLSRLERTVEEATATSETAKREADRLRNFLLFALSVHYQRNRSAHLSSDDRKLYLGVRGALTDLRSAQERLRPFECAKFASYLWHHLHEPCKALTIPIECAARTVLDFFTFQTLSGGYQGAPDGLLRTYGAGVLAQKQGRDAQLLLPQIVPRKALLAEIMGGLDVVADTYFACIPRIDSATGPSCGNVAGWKVVQSVSYVLNEHGEACEAARFARMATVRQSRVFSHEQHWALRAMKCTDRILDRKERTSSVHDEHAGGPDNVPRGNDRYRGWRTAETLHHADL